jgi:hypothetical protein
LGRRGAGRGGATAAVDGAGAAAHGAGAAADEAGTAAVLGEEATAAARVEDRENESARVSARS